MIKEFRGYFIAKNYNDYLTYNENTICKDKTTFLNFDYNEFTDEEKIILNSYNHCLYYYFLPYDNLEKKDCFNSELLQSSKDKEIKCGYYNFIITIRNGGTENFQTCYFFNPDFLEYKTIDWNTKKYFDELVNDFSDYDFQSYNIMISTNDGIYAEYNSETNKIVGLEDDNIWDKKETYPKYRCTSTILKSSDNRCCIITEKYNFNGYDFDEFQTCVLIQNEAFYFKNIDTLLFKELYGYSFLKMRIQKKVLIFHLKII